MDNSIATSFHGGIFGSKAERSSVNALVILIWTALGESGLILIHIGPRAFPVDNCTYVHFQQRTLYARLYAWARRKLWLHSSDILHDIFPESYRGATLGFARLYVCNGIMKSGRLGFADFGRGFSADHGSTQPSS